MFFERSREDHEKGSVLVISTTLDDHNIVHSDHLREDHEKSRDHHSVESDVLRAESRRTG